MTISELCRLVGLETHTVRFYEKNFPKTLAVARTIGGHRMYTSKNLESLRSILTLLREENLSLKQAQIRLGEVTEESFGKTDATSVGSAKQSGDELQISHRDALSGHFRDTPPSVAGELFSVILKRLEELAQRQNRQDQLVEKLLNERNHQDRADLLLQISSLRRENQEVCRLIETMAVRPSLPGNPADMPREIRSGPMVLRPENEPKNHVPHKTTTGSMVQRLINEPKNHVPGREDRP